MIDVNLIDTIIEASISQPDINEVLKTAGYNTRPEPHDEFCLQFSERVARSYLAGELTFTQADQAANWLFAHSYVSENCPGEMPIFARQIFEAFDNGEYYHDGDSRDVDPESKYTRPQVQQLLNELDAEEESIDIEAYKSRKDEETSSLEDILRRKQRCLAN
jgi:hypothetical protein